MADTETETRTYAIQNLDRLCSCIVQWSHRLLIDSLYAYWSNAQAAPSVTSRYEALKTRHRWTGKCCYFAGSWYGERNSFYSGIILPAPMPGASRISRRRRWVTRSLRNANIFSRSLSCGFKPAYRSATPRHSLNIFNLSHAIEKIWLAGSLMRSCNGDRHLRAGSYEIDSGKYPFLQGKLT